jgi:hypothetical protein
MHHALTRLKSAKSVGQILGQIRAKSWAKSFDQTHEGGLSEPR